MTGADFVRPVAGLVLSTRPKIQELMGRKAGTRSRIRVILGKFAGQTFKETGEAIRRTKKLVTGR